MKRFKNVICGAIGLLSLNLIACGTSDSTNPTAEIQVNATTVAAIESTSIANVSSNIETETVTTEETTEISNETETDKNVNDEETNVNKETNIALSGITSTTEEVVSSYNEDDNNYSDYSEPEITTEPETEAPTKTSSSPKKEKCTDLHTEHPDAEYKLIKKTFRSSLNGETLYAISPDIIAYNVNVLGHEYRGESHYTTMDSKNPQWMVWYDDTIGIAWFCDYDGNIDAHWHY
jgi:hypothetical protein